MIISKSLRFRGLFCFNCLSSPDNKLSYPPAGSSLDPPIGGGDLDICILQTYRPAFHGMEVFMVWRNTWHVSSLEQIQNNQYNRWLLFVIMNDFRWKHLLL